MTAPDHTSMLFKSQLARTGVSIHAPWLPGLSEACGGEVGASLVAGGLALAQGAVNFVAGYVVREYS